MSGKRNLLRTSEQERNMTLKKGDLVKWIHEKPDVGSLGWNRDLGVILSVAVVKPDLNIYNVYWIKDMKPERTYPIYFTLVNKDNDEKG